MWCYTKSTLELTHGNKYDSSPNIKRNVFGKPKRNWMSGLASTKGSRIAKT